MFAIGIRFQLNRTNSCLFNIILYFLISLEGWAAGDSLPFNHENYLKQKYYMQKYLHKWKAIEAGRDGAMPHIKVKNDF